MSHQRLKCHCKRSHPFVSGRIGESWESLEVSIGFRRVPRGPASAESRNVGALALNAGNGLSPTPPNTTNNTYNYQPHVSQSPELSHPPILALPSTTESVKMSAIAEGSEGPNEVIQVLFALHPSYGAQELCGPLEVLSNARHKIKDPCK